MKHTELYRFHDRIALSLRDVDNTIYLTLKETKEIVKAMKAIAKDIKDIPFSKSSIPVFVIPMI